MNIKGTYVARARPLHSRKWQERTKIGDAQQNALHLKWDVIARCSNSFCTALQFVSSHFVIEQVTSCPSLSCFRPVERSHYRSSKTEWKLSGICKVKCYSYR